MKPQLDSDIIKKITSVLKDDSRIYGIKLFGSRAKGTASNGSDIDIAILSDAMTFKDICALSVKIDYLDLPYKVDIVDYNSLENLELKKHIDGVGISL